MEFFGSSSRRGGRQITNWAKFEQTGWARFSYFSFVIRFLKIANILRTTVSYEAVFGRICIEMKLWKMFFTFALEKKIPINLKAFDALNFQRIRYFLMLIFNELRVDETANASQFAPQPVSIYHAHLHLNTRQLINRAGLRFYSSSCTLEAS